MNQKKSQVQKKRNPVAKALRNPKYSQKIVEKKTVYNRKDEHDFKTKKEQSMVKIFKLRDEISQKFHGAPIGLRQLYQWIKREIGVPIPARLRETAAFSEFVKERLVGLRQLLAVLG